MGCTILAVPSVPPNSVRHFAVISFSSAHVFSASQGEDYIAIGCTSGIYVSNRGANCGSSKYLTCLGTSHRPSFLQHIRKFWTPTNRLPWLPFKIPTNSSYFVNRHYIRILLRWLFGLLKGNSHMRASSTRRKSWARVMRKFCSLKQVA